MMSGSARKRKSLWDRIGERQLPAQTSEKNAWHEKESYSNLHVSHDPKWSDLEDDNALMSKDFSGRSSWELSKGSGGQKDDRRDFNDIPETRKACDGNKSYHLSSGFDGLEQQNRSRSPENSRSQSCRYKRSSSRSPSRSRGRGWGRSRSPSRGMGRSRSRDRDRDRERGRGRSRSRSRSPLGSYRQESYRWSERRSGLGVLSQPCRDFAVGKCRRGSECRFLHQDNSNHKDGGRLESERSERWRSTQERGGNSYDGEKDEPLRSSSKSTMVCNDFLKGRCHRGSSCRYSHHDASGYNSERSNRNSSLDHDYKRQPRKDGNAPCKFFMMGNCNRENCRFSHDGPTHGYGEGKSQDDSRGNNFYDMDKSWNGPKWGEATAVLDISHSTGWDNIGKETFINAEELPDDRRGHGLEDKNRQWNHPKWGDASVSEIGRSTDWGNSSAVSDISQSTGWGNVGKDTIAPETADKQTDDRRGRSLEDKNEHWNGRKWGDASVSEIGSTGWRTSSAENIYLTDQANADKHADDRFDYSVDNQSTMWAGPVRKDKDAERDENKSPHLGSSHAVKVGIAISEDVGKSFDRKELPLSPSALPSQISYGISKDIHEQSILQEASGGHLDTTVMHSVVPRDSQIQQHQTKMGDVHAMIDDFNSANGVDIYGITTHPPFVPRQNLNQNADTFASQISSVGGINRSPHMVSVNPSNGLNIDLNGPVQRNLSPSKPQNQAQIHHGESVKPIVNSTMPQNAVNTEQVGQLTNHPTSLMQIIGNGQLPQLYVALNPSNSVEPSVSLLPPVTSIVIQPDPATISRKQYDPMGDSVEPTMADNCNQPPGCFSGSINQKNEMLSERSSPSSAVGLDLVKLPKNDCLEDKSCRSPELRQQRQVANSVLEENSKSIVEKPKQELENIPAGNVDANPRIVDGNTEKDEKAMRLFKIALVEFVKEILKPKWKEGQMSREVHKNIVKKVVDKVTSTIQGVNIPKAQDKIDQYLSYSKPKLTKLVEAYTERFSKSS